MQHSTERNPSEPHIRMVFVHKGSEATTEEELFIPYSQAYQWIRSFIPLWLLDSTIDPPEPEATSAFKANPTMLTALRSGVKMMIRPWLPAIWKGFYGVDLQLGRKDSLPYIMKFMVDFIIIQMVTHPLQIEVKADGRVESVRQSDKSGSSNHTRESRSEPFQAEESGV